MLATDGVKKAQFAFRSVTAAARFVVRISSDGTQIVAPRRRTARVSPTETSNKKEQNWKTREVGVTWSPSHMAAELEAILLCSITTPFGNPVLPDVKMT